MAYRYKSPPKFQRINILILLLTLSLWQSTHAAFAQDEQNAALALPPRLSVMDIDSARFPEVTVLLNINGSDGLPIQGVSAGDFLLLEDNQLVQPQSSRLETALNQALNLVLLIDRSTDAESWPGVVNAFEVLVTSLQDQDQVAAFSYANGLDRLFGYQSDSAAIREALGSLEPGGDFSALNPALLEGIALAQGRLNERSVILVIADSPDNISTTPTLAEVIDAAQAAEIPIYLFAYGAKIQAFPEIRNLSTRTRGHAYIADSATALGNSLRQQLILLRQAYRLSFRSQVAADGQPHSLSIALPSNGATEPVVAQFEAVPATLEISLPHVSAGQPVGGEVNLTASATTPAEIALVEYWLNGSELLARVDTTDYSIIWDSASVEPGLHTIEVIVEDAAGNRGQTSVELEVVPPVRVSALQPRAVTEDVARVGGEVILAAEVSALQALSRVEFFVDRTLVGSAQEPPYTVESALADFTPGSHTLTVRAQDIHGYEAVSTLEFQLEPALNSLFSGGNEKAGTLLSTAAAQSAGAGGLFATLFSWVLTAALWLVGLGGAVAAVLAGRRWWMSRAHVPLARCRFVLTNRGNEASHYLLRAEEASLTLSFRFSQNGIPLNSPVATRTQTAQRAAPDHAAVYHRHFDVNGMQMNLGRQSAGGAQRRVDKQNTSSAPPGNWLNKEQIPGNGLGANGVNLEEASTSLDEVATIGQAVADLLTTVAYILPASLGRPVRSVAMMIRRSQRMARRVQRAKKQVDKVRNVTQGTKTAAGASKVAAGVSEVATSETTHRTVQNAGQTTQNFVGTTVAGVTQRVHQMRASSANSVAVLDPVPRPVGIPFGVKKQVHRAKVNQSDRAATAHRIKGETGAAAAHDLSSDDWVETPYVPAGKSFAFEVLVISKKIPDRTGRVPFQIISLAVDDPASSTVVEEVRLQVTGVSWFTRQLRHLSTRGSVR